MFEQDRVLVRLQQRVMQEDDVLVCFLSGSYGRNSQDRYSDLDVVLVFENESIRISAYERRQEFVRSILPYVPARSFDADHIRPFFHVTLYGNGAKVDFRYETKATLKPNPWERDIRLLKDTNNWGEQFRNAASSLPATIPQPKITAQELTSIDERFWVMFMDTFRLLSRGDYAKPFPIYIEFLYFTIPRLLSLLPTDDPAHQALIQASFSHDTAVTIEHMKNLFRAYIFARNTIISRFNVPFEIDEIFERSVSKYFN